MAYDSSYTGTQIDEAVQKTQNLFNLIYPVGSIYMSVNSTSPATLFGGTWIQIQDKFLLCAGSSYGAGTSGGSASSDHTHNVTSSGSVDGHTLTVAEIPNHNHTAYVDPNFCAVSTGNNNSWKQNLVSASQPEAGSSGYYNCSVGGSGSHNHGFTGYTTTSTGASNTNNMPPYLAVYVWKRTA